MDGLKIDCCRILKIANAARQGMAKANAEKKTVIAGARISAFLCLRPDLAQGKFVKAEDQKRCQNEHGSVKFPLGSHRMREDWHKENTIGLIKQVSQFLKIGLAATVAVKLIRWMSRMMRRYTIVLLSKTSSPLIMTF